MIETFAACSAVRPGLEPTRRYGKSAPGSENRPHARAEVRTPIDLLDATARGDAGPRVNPGLDREANDASRGRLLDGAAGPAGFRAPDIVGAESAVLTV